MSRSEVPHMTSHLARCSLAPLLLLASLPAAAADPAGALLRGPLHRGEDDPGRTCPREELGLGAGHRADRPALHRPDGDRLREHTREGPVERQGADGPVPLPGRPHPGRGHRARRARVHRRHRGVVPRSGHGRHAHYLQVAINPRSARRDLLIPEAGGTILHYRLGSPISPTPSTRRAPSRIGRTGTSGGRWSCSFPGAAWAGRPWT